MDLKDMTTGHKVLLLGGAGMVVFFLGRALLNHGSGAAASNSTAAPVDQNQVQQDLGSYVTGAVGQASQAFTTQLQDYQQSQQKTMQDFQTQEQQSFQAFGQQEQQQISQFITASQQQQQQSQQAISQQIQAMQQANQQTLTSITSLLSQMPRQTQFSNPVATTGSTIAPPMQSAVSQLAAINSYVHDHAGSLTPAETQAYHNQKQQIANSQGWTLSNDGFVKDANGSLIAGAQPIAAAYH